MKTIVMIAVLVASIAPMLVATTNVSASSGCYDHGYFDGKDHPFSQSKYEDCGGNQGAGNNDYYDGFVAGCLSVEGNTAEICEGATDD